MMKYWRWQSRSIDMKKTMHTDTVHPEKEKK